MTPQVQTLLTHLQQHGSISQAEAATVYRIRALPRRISDLKEAGWPIKRELKVDPTGQRYARYSLVTLKKGDRVRVIDSNSSISRGSCYEVGEEGSVVSFDGKTLRVAFHDYTFYVHPLEVEVIA
jgi:hypothetical protein